MYKVDLSRAVSMTVGPTTSAADALKELMAYQHLTQVELAQHAAISQQQLFDILNHKSFMSTTVAQQIAAATGLSAKWLLQLDINDQYGQRRTEKPIAVSIDEM